MTRLRIGFLMCDGCGRSHDNPVLNILRRQGWRIPETAKDFCPTCVEDGTADAEGEE